MFKTVSIATALMVSLVAPAAAATLNGTFNIDIYHRMGANSAQSDAVVANLDPAQKIDTITYTGDLFFGTPAATDIAGWLATGSGTYTPFANAATAGTLLSAPNINDGTATATFFDISAILASAYDFTIRHDDGISVFDDGTLLSAVSAAGPTTAIVTTANGFDGGAFRLIYAATNGNPSILEVSGDLAPVPLPAALPLLLIGMGGFAALRRRRART